MIRIPFSGPDICDLYANIIVTFQKGCLGREISFENLVVMDELPDLDSKTLEIPKILDCIGCIVVTFGWVLTVAHAWDSCFTTVDLAKGSGGPD